MMKSYYLLAILVCILGTAQAQTSSYQENPTATVVQNGTAMATAWCGGINSSQIQKADLNNDGTEDLIIYDHNTRTLKTFINESTSPGVINYRYAPKYAKNFPTIQFYAILKDYNCDGIPDLFHRGTVGIAAYKGAYINDELTFTFFKDLYYPSPSGPINAYVQPNDVPSIVDIDRDGDLDFVSFDVIGTKMPFYKNMRVENGYSCDSINIIEQTTCWGSVTQGFYRTHDQNVSCKGGSGSLNKTRHTGNCILHVDVDGDSDYDLFGANVSFSDVQLLYNGGSLNSALITSQDTLFDADNHELELNTWPVSNWLDIDNDGKNDLVFTPHLNDISSANYNSIALYKNIGTTANPSFDWINDSTLINDIIDVGSYSYPTLFDYDKDGKLDLFVGGAGYFNSITKLRENKLAYYRNTSTPNNISFELITRDFLNLSSKNYTGIYPTFGDITGDNIDDLVLGNDSGYVAVYRNMASSNSAPANFTFQTDSLAGIDVGNFSFPLIYDYNQDGKTDLIIGNEIGYINLYQDSSATSSKDLKLVDNQLGGIKVGSSFTFLGYAAPFIGYIDSTLETALMIGNADGVIEIYDSIDQNYNNIPRTDSFYTSIQTAYRAVPTVGDLDNNGSLDLIIGNQNGGLQLFTMAPNNSGSIGLNQISKGNLNIELYPNPTRDELFLTIDALGSDRKLNIDIIDLTGRSIEQGTYKNDKTISLSTSHLNAGIYFIKIESNDQVGVKKFIKE